MKKNLLIYILLLLSLTLSACSYTSTETITEVAAATDNASIESVVEEINPVTEATAEETEIPRSENWSEETHSNEVEPNYDVVFPQDEVNRLDITVTSESWQAMMADLDTLYGNNNAAGGRGGKGGGGNDVAALEGDDTNPMWVTATIAFEGDVWENVGLRFKGNSSLSSTWRNGDNKFPIKLDFDEFEDEYPEINDQRFYGFKQLSLSSNFSDNSFLREKAAADIFRESGVPAAQTAFYEVYLDYGEGSTYLGLYTMVEVVDDTLIETQFEDDSGNVYKPDGTGATFAANSFSEGSFDKETNEEEADYSDILALYDVLHSETRTSNSENWRTELESVFDVDGFLNYLAINNIIQNWDTYGNMTHNYYLYNDPETGLLTWIPWDNNEAFSPGKREGTLSLSMDEVSANWPLISYLMDDPVYNEIYTNYLAETVTGAFNAEKMAATYQELAALIAPYASVEVGEAAFNSAVQEMISHAYQRADVVNTYLNNQ